ncbi:Copper chaperone [Paracholeplasma brassicae]|jgi:copper chaperone CopZ|uniref:Copper chaperone n=1 Tax=Acholeplasma brassicae TaxID=61635 RepID=U4KPX5_9MOLU|nr:cation transporter [Paracholeplasma brassicae]CCV66557.1 Copper chaperone [Paracholeplasma brassicae]HBT59607.1 copper chaperone [Acholeplasmataceae bacterium]
MKQMTLQLETLTCPSCLLKIEKGLKRLEGIDKDSVEVMFNSSRVKLSFDDSKLDSNEIQKTIENIGYDVLKTTLK